MPEAIYILCAVTSLACAALLARGYRRSRTRLLLWSGLCFLGLAFNNMFLFLDKVVVRDHDLSLWRSISALAGLALLLYGLIWDSE